MKSITKRLLLLFVLLTTLYQIDFGQTQIIHPSPKGIFVLLGRDFAKDFTYEVYRKKTSDRDFMHLASIAGSKNRSQFYQRLDEAAAKIPSLLPVSSMNADRYWSYFETHENLDSLIIIDAALGYLGLGLGYLDTTPHTGQTYQYRIDKVRNGVTIESLESGEFTYILPNPQRDVELFSSDYDGEKSIAIKWTLFDKIGLQGFNLYRRENLQGDFTKLPLALKYRTSNDTTFINLRDTLIEPYQVYQYQIQPVDLFGNEGEVANYTQQASFSDFDFPYLSNFNAVSRDNRQMEISWKMDIKPFIRSLKVLRSTQFDTGFVQLAELPPTDTSFVDHIPVAMENYYYRLILNGPHGISKPTVVTFGRYLELEKPDAAVNIRGTGMSDGTKIEWDDYGRTTYGFYVFRKASNQNQFEQISDLIIIDTSRHYVYYDTSSTLRGDINYDYCIQTINDGYQPSDFSDTITVRPDLPTEIAMPTGFRLRKVGKGCYLFWNDLSKVDDNLWGYTLYRRRLDQDSAQVIAELISASSNHFHDTTINTGYSYEYQLQARNYFGAKSTLTYPQRASWYAVAPAPPPPPRVTTSANGIMLRWSEIRQKGLAGYNIYRYQPGENPFKVISTSAEQHSFEDDNIVDGKLYFYYLTTTNEEGLESTPGKSVSIRR